MVTGALKSALKKAVNDPQREYRTQYGSKREEDASRGEHKATGRASCIFSSANEVTDRNHKKVSEGVRPSGNYRFRSAFLAHFSLISQKRNGTPRLHGFLYYKNQWLIKLQPAR